MKTRNKVFWFMGGFGIGLTLISLGHAALPKRATPETAEQPAQSSSVLSEINSQKVAAPDLERDYAGLSQNEAKFAESWDQQQRLKSATARVAMMDRSKKKTVTKKDAKAASQPKQRLKVYDSGLD